MRRRIERERRTVDELHALGEIEGDDLEIVLGEKMLRFVERFLRFFQRAELRRGRNLRYRSGVGGFFGFFG